MVWPHPPNPRTSVAQALSYSDRFDYPLTLTEVWFWQPYTAYPIILLAPFYKNRDQLLYLRKKRWKYSQKKWLIAKKAVEIIKNIPSLQAVFITGALAMDNCPRLDDIDIMIITTPHALWLTRLLIISLLKFHGLRRHPHLPEHSSVRVNNKICDNLWLDQKHLCITSRNLYTAHEVLQAKCLFDRGGVHRQFLVENSWAKKYLSIAYRETLKQCGSPATPNHQSKISNILLFTVNYLLFTVQYLYMRPRLTHEKVGLGYAFFHPNSPGV
jgi:hypothetical protein